MNSIVRVNAFIGQNLLGNPAAVSISHLPLDSNICQDIAAENQLPVTAFICLLEGNFFIRWFTPVSEPPLCGHGTLAASFVIFQQHLNQSSEITFHSPQAGELKATQQEDIIFLNFPMKHLSPIQCPENLIAGLGNIKPEQVYDAGDRMLVVLENAHQVKAMEPQIELLKTLAYPGIVITALGETVDFVSRTFYPNKPDWEDAVTGASHCALVPYWATVLKKENLHAYQVSPRGGELFCIKQGNRTLLGGRVSWASQL